MSKPETNYNRDPLRLTLAQVKQYVDYGKKEYCCINQPLLNIPLDHIVLDELHLLLRITDVILDNIIEDAMERDDKERILMTQRREKLERGKHLRKLRSSTTVESPLMFGTRKMQMERVLAQWTVMSHFIFYIKLHHKF